MRWTQQCSSASTNHWRFFLSPPRFPFAEQPSCQSFSLQVDSRIRPCAGESSSEVYILPTKHSLCSQCRCLRWQETLGRNRHNRRTCYTCRVALSLDLETRIAWVLE